MTDRLFVTVAAPNTDVRHKQSPTEQENRRQSGDTGTTERVSVSVVTSLGLPSGMSAPGDLL